MRFRSVQGAGLAVLVILAWSTPPAGAASLPAGTTAILSGAPSLLASLPMPVANATLTQSAVSQDGRYVAFSSQADGLAPDDDDRVRNVYVKDRQTGGVVHASRTAAGQAADQDCYDAAISDDGLRVAFVCRGALTPADTNTDTDVYLRDLQTQTTVLVSRGSGLGPVGNDDSSGPVLSQDGTYVAFTSEAANLGGLGTNVYRRRIGGGDGLVLVSRADGASGAPVSGYEPSISDDGDVVAFTSTSDTDVDDGNVQPDVYVRRIGAGTTALVSRADGPDGAVGNQQSSNPAVAGNGSAVVFESSATQFDNAHDNDVATDIYRRDLTTFATTLMSMNAAGDKATASWSPSIDDSGDAISFAAEATALDADDTHPAADVYVRLGNALEVASRADGTTGAVANLGVETTSISGDGGKVAMALPFGLTPDADPAVQSVFLRDVSALPRRTTLVSRPAGTAPFVNQGSSAGAPVLSADGRYAAFQTSAPALLPAGVAVGIVVRDRVTGAVTLASRADGVGGAPFTGLTFEPDISADGRRVAFTATPTLDESESRGAVWVRDLPSGRTWLASRADGPDGAPANEWAWEPSLDADGSHVAFTTSATNMGNGDGDPILDIHVRDLEAGRTRVASVSEIGMGGKGDGQSTKAALNGDGTRVAFLSRATNLNAGDTDAFPDGYVHDLVTRRTALISATPTGTGSGYPTLDIDLDAAGRRIVFVSQAPNLGVRAALWPKAYVRDLDAGTLVLAGRGDGADGVAAQNVVKARISPDGRYVAFQSDAQDLVAGVDPQSRQVFRRDLAEQRTALVSRRSGDGAPGTEAHLGGISAGGACVGFASLDLVGQRADALQAYVRTFADDCGDPRQPAPPPGPQEPGRGGAGGGGTTGARDTVAPVLRAVRLSRSRFRVARFGTALSAAVGRGSVLGFRSSEAGTLSLVLERVVPGRRRGGRCRAVKRRPRRGACTAYRRSGRLSRRIVAGTGRVKLSGRVGRRALPAGSYRLTVGVRDAAGNRSNSVTLRIRIVSG